MTLTMRHEDWDALERWGWAGTRTTRGKPQDKTALEFLFTLNGDEIGLERRRELTQRLVGSGSDVVAADSDGWTLLHRLISGGEGDGGSFDVLVAGGALINAVDVDGWSPLHLAVIHSNTPIVAWALRQGANPNARLGWGESEDSEGATPWLDAVAINGQDKVILDLMKLHGAKLDDTNAKGRCALHLASHACLEWVLEHTGLAVDIRDHEQRTPLMYQSYPPTVQMLIEAGADVHACDARGQSALMLSARHDGLSKIKLLIDAGADILGFDHDGLDALAHAEQGQDGQQTLAYLREVHTKAMASVLDAALPTRPTCPARRPRL